MAFSLLFLAILATGVGSAYYHLDPSDERLFWDRLPITLGFTSLLAIIIGDRLGSAIGSRLLGPLCMIGVATALYWRWAGDLRPYALAQFLPLLAIPLLIALFPPRHSHSHLVIAALGCYGVAKVCELLDAPLYSATAHLLSGHTLKHLAAAIATLLLVMLPVRRTLLDL
jgi:hypothetical protein